MEPLTTPARTLSENALFAPIRAPWSVNDLPFDAIDRTEAARDEHLLLTIAGASFVEITSDLYADNLIRYFTDEEAVAWLRDHWQREELNHGAALRRYVEIAWPDFPWEDAYRGFFAEYSALCRFDRLGPTPALEMLARCVVETGTATFYRMMSDVAAEPVLAALAARISADEVNHYKNFYYFFRRFRARERTRSVDIARTLWRRVDELDDEDMYIALKHAFQARHPGETFDRARYDAFQRAGAQTVRTHFPFANAVKMVIKPLDLSPPVRRAIQPVLVGLARTMIAPTGRGARIRRALANRRRPRRSAIDRPPHGR